MKEPIQIIIGAIFIGAYWYFGGYALTWFLPDPMPVQTARIGMAIGLTIFVVGNIYEEFGYKFPPPLGCLMFAPPGAMIFVGVVFWVMSFFGLVEDFRR